MNFLKYFWQNFVISPWSNCPLDQDLKDQLFHFTFKAYRNSKNIFFCIRVEYDKKQIKYSTIIAKFFLMLQVCQLIYTFKISYLNLLMSPESKSN